MKNLLKTALICVMLVLVLNSAYAKGSSQNPDQTELVVFAAASMTETLEEISGLYAKAAPNIKLVLILIHRERLKPRFRKALSAICLSLLGRDKWTSLT